MEKHSDNEINNLDKIDNFLINFQIAHLILISINK